MSYEGGHKYIGLLSKMKPLREETKELKNQIICYMKKQDVSSLRVNDRQINLVNKRVKRTLNLRLLRRMVSTYTQDPVQQSTIRAFLDNVSDHLEQNAVVKEALQYQ